MKNTSNPADPYMTLVGYFNSLRELGGSRRIVEDEVASRVGAYGSRKRGSIKEDGMSEDESRIAAQDEKGDETEAHVRRTAANEEAADETPESDDVEAHQRRST